MAHVIENISMKRPVLTSLRSWAVWSNYQCFRRQIKFKQQ